VRITNAVKCLPPPTSAAAEIKTATIPSAELERSHRFVPYSPGRIAMPRSAGAACAEGAPFRARRGARIETRVLIDSYHCSRYNTRLAADTPMFEAVVARPQLAHRMNEMIRCRPFDAKSFVDGLPARPACIACWMPGRESLRRQGANLKSG